MVREYRHFAQDILDAIDFAQRATRGKTYDDFEQNLLLRLALERAIEIISEASRHIPDEYKAAHPGISWQRVKAIGNVLRHEYHTLSNNIIWKAIEDELPGLRVAMQAILDEMNRRQ